MSKTHRVTFGHYLTNGDCIPWLGNYSDQQSDLIFCDPPFNIGHSYDRYEDKRPAADYLAWCRSWITPAVAALKPRGAFWLAIGDDFAAELNLLCKEAGLVQRNWVIWHFRFGPHLTSKFGRNKTHLQYFTKGKGKPAYWNPDAVREKSVRQEIGDKRADPRGRVPGDVWDFSRICGTFKERTDHPCQMPEAVLERILKSTCPPNGLALDPFSGSGVTHAAGLKTNRFVHSCEISEPYCNLAIKRLTANAKPI